ncbi:MAG TPA: YlxR family protein [Candidatus Dormibacteraeota bacterium]
MPQGSGAAPRGRLPQRSCAGCRRAAPKRELIRLVLPADPDATVAVDLSGRQEGRGAYLCKETALACLALARRRRALPRALRTSAARVDPDALAATLQLAPAAPSPPRR